MASRHNKKTVVTKQAGELNKLLKITENLNHVKDIDSLLDRILFEARRFTNADAGSIYLREGEKLRFSYVQNDTMAAQDPANNKYLYTTHEIDISDRSIAGHVARSASGLIVDDAYTIGSDLPYGFNRSFDERTGYRTRTMLTVPMVTSKDTVIGVMQIINARDGHNRPRIFTENDKMFVTFFANNASVAIERAKMTREIILRMIRMAELRDPRETANHVNRVGAYSIEIYDAWARAKGISLPVIKRMKDILRIAAMLHDVGKVAISDTILKKPGKLTDQEYAVMKMHSLFGFRLFDEAVSDLDTLCAEIALNHHERWDGKGYPGDFTDYTAEQMPSGKGKAGEEIPVAARVVALADVYDALISKRVYKDAWPEDKVLEHLKNAAGNEFDPDIVAAFMKIYDVIAAIRDHYSD